MLSHLFGDECPIEPGEKRVLCVVRYDERPNRPKSWAYVEFIEGRAVMPPHFLDAYGDDVAKVPKRFAAEIKRAMDERNAKQQPTDKGDST